MCTNYEKVVSIQASMVTFSSSLIESVAYGNW